MKRIVQLIHAGQTAASRWRSVKATKSKSIKYLLELKLRTRYKLQTHDTVVFAVNRGIAIYGSIVEPQDKVLKPNWSFIAT